MSASVPDLAGGEIGLDVGAIERGLVDLWRGDGDDAESPVTKAALWNVIVHTENEKDHAFARAVIGKASGVVPQRSLMVLSMPAAPPDLRAWISANCHLLDGNRKVCSEEVSMVAGGERVHHMSSLLNALLIPEMPVAAWWVGDLPNQHESYLAALLDPVDRLIVDSVSFDSVDDLKLLIRFSAETNTCPADLNWSRLEEWRLATASMFDFPQVLAKMRRIRSVEITSGVSSPSRFGDQIEAIYVASWLLMQCGYIVSQSGGFSNRDGDVTIIYHPSDRQQPGRLDQLKIMFDDDSFVLVERPPSLGGITARASGLEQEIGTVTPLLNRETDNLIVRELSRAAGDEVFRRVLPAAAKLGARKS